MRDIAQRIERRRAARKCHAFVLASQAVGEHRRRDNGAAVASTAVPARAHWTQRRPCQSHSWHICTQASSVCPSASSGSSSSACSAAARASSKVSPSAPRRSPPGWSTRLPARPTPVRSADRVAAPAAVGDAGRGVVRVHAVDQESSEQIQLMGLCIDGAPARRHTHLFPHARARRGVCLLAQQRRSQLLHDRPCDVVLHRKDVVQLPVVSLRPQV